MFYQVANALHAAFGVRPDTEQHAILLLETEVAPEVARLRAIAAAAHETLGAGSADELRAAIAALRAGAVDAGAPTSSPARAD